MNASDESRRLEELESLLITAEILADGLKRPDLNGTVMCIKDSLREIRQLQREKGRADPAQVNTQRE